MKKQIIIDILAFIAFLISAFSGVVMWLALPSQSGKISLEFLSLARHQWNAIHLFSSLIFVVIIIIHLALHWKWIKNIPRLWNS